MKRRFCWCADRCLERRGAPYGYRRREAELPESHKGDRDKRRVTLEPVQEEARTVARIFELFVGQKMSPKAIANELNQPGGPPSPTHVDSSRNVRGAWSGSTVRAMLKNPVYTGRTVWNRLDFTEAKQSGGGARRRAREEWVVAEDTHLAIVEDATFEAAQERFATKARGAASSHGKRTYLFAGMIKCAADHGPAAMQGKARKGHHYYCCEYAARYGETEALAAHGGAKTVSIREDRLLKLVLRFFEQRIFGPLRIERLAKQLRAQARSERAEGKLAGTKLRKQIAEIDRKIKAQVIALEEGVEPELVTERIAELRGEKEALVAALAEIGVEREEAEDEELARQLQRVPDLAKSLAEATPAVQRQVFEAFELRIAYDKVGGRVEISATVSEAVASAFEDTKALQKEGSMVVARDIAGAGFEPATFGL